MGAEMVLAGGYGIGLVLGGAGVACVLAGLRARRTEARTRPNGLGAALGGRARRPVRLRLAPPPRAAAPREAGEGHAGQARPALRRAFPERGTAPDARHA